MKIIFMYEPDVDPLSSTQLTWSQRNCAFVPLDQVPDDGLDPFEALAIKEEQELNGNAHEVGSDDIGESSPLVLAACEKIEEDSQESAPAPMICQEEVSSAHDTIADSVESSFFYRVRRKVCVDKKLNRLFGYRSYGKRGPKAPYKDKFSRIYIW
jgi:hypothetical protein